MPLAYLLSRLLRRIALEWAEHVFLTTGASPTPQAVEAWFRSKPKQYFQEKGNVAVNWFTGFARALLKDETLHDREQAVRSAVGNLDKFWPSFWAGNLIGITSNIVFTGLVVLFVVFINSDFSFIAWTKRLLADH